MGKSLFIAEKPSVAQEFARALKISGKKGDGFIESETAVVTWCVGHLVTMSYPESYDPSLKPVSYTHLDVYKRQIPGTLPSSGTRASVKWMRTSFGKRL